MRGPDKFRQIWLTVRLPLFLQKDKLAGQTIAAAACETIGSNPGTPSPYLFCYRLSCRSTRHNSYAAPSVFRNCRKTRSRSSPSSAAATSASRRWSICSQVAAAWPKFRHPGQDAAYQPFPHQRQLVSGRSARLRLRPHIENPTRRVRQNHHRLRTPMRTDALPCSWLVRFPHWSPRRSTCALSKCSAGRASLSASSLPKPTKLSAAQLARSVERYKQVLGEQWEGLPPMFRSSSEKRTGREEILDFIGKCLTEC